MDHEVDIEAAVVEANIKAEADMVEEIAIVEVDAAQTGGHHGMRGVDYAESTGLSEGELGSCAFARRLEWGIF